MANQGEAEAVGRGDMSRAARPVSAASPSAAGPPRAAASGAAGPSAAASPRAAAPVQAGSPAAKTPRAEQTRNAIIDAALRLFREKGYEATTMRAIAREAGVATGNAYYYFGSKEELIQEFYARNQAEHLAACCHVLDAETKFAVRLRGVLRALIDVLSPYHALAAKFYKHAAEPTSPLSPFSKASSPAREASIAIYREVVEGMTTRIDPQLRPRLPELLWLYSMGIVLFWVHDTSPGCTKTYRLIDITVPLADRLISLSRLRTLRPATRQVIAIIDEMRS